MAAREDYRWNQKELEEFRLEVIKEKHLKCRTDDIFLLSFLRSRKYDRERALQLLKNYYSVRRKYTIVFKDLRPSTLEMFLEMNMMCFKVLESGQVLGFGRVSHWEAEKVSPIDVFRCILLLGDFQLNHHPIQVNGVYTLMDVSTLSWRHLIRFTPRFFYIAASCLFQSYPISYKGIHVVNVNKYLHAIVAMAWPFFPYKIKQRIHLHGSDMKNLHKVIDAKYLPEEFGGELPFNSHETNQQLKDNEEFFIENEKYWTEEKNM